MITVRSLVKSVSANVSANVSEIVSGNVSGNVIGNVSGNSNEKVTGTVRYIGSPTRSTGGGYICSTNFVLTVHA